MLIYSETIQSFLKKINFLAKEIIKNELNYQFSGKRVLIGTTYYPLNFVCFEHLNTLGFYDPKIYQIGINKLFIQSIDEELLRNILRHEIAHFLCHVFYGDSHQVHGKEFKEVFIKYNWDCTFSKAQISLKEINMQNELEQKLLEKVQKLLSLSESENEFEAKLATKKANDLILKYNLNDSKILESEETYVLRVCEYKKKNALHDGLYQVLAKFYVTPVFNQGRGGGYLEVVGSKVNVTIAGYACDYLTRSIESIWKSLKNSDHQLKGVVAKNTFTRAFCDSVATELDNELVRQTSSKELIVLKGELQVHMERVYPRLRKSYSTPTKEDPRAKALGRELGSKFKINKGLKNSKERKLLNFFKK